MNKQILLAITLEAAYQRSVRAPYLTRRQWFMRSLPCIRPMLKEAGELTITVKRPTPDKWNVISGME